MNNKCTKSVSKSMLSIPPLGAGMKRYIDRRRLGIASELTQACVNPFVPGNQLLPLMQRRADEVCLLVRQGRARVKRPTAEVETKMIGIEALVASGGQHNLPPPDCPQLQHHAFLDRQQHKSSGQRSFDPRADSLIEHRIDAAVSHCVEPALFARPRDQLQLAAPGFEIRQCESVERK